LEGDKDEVARLITDLSILNFKEYPSL
jgi:hypothetical protein